MQKPSDFSQNRLLSHTIRFLHGDKSKFDNILSLLDTTSIEHLVLTFSFLINWLSNHLMDESMIETYDDAIQSVFQLASLILKKVPPVVFYHRLPENIFGSSDCSHWLINELLEPIKKRILRLRSYINPHDAFDLMCTIEPVFHTDEKEKDKSSNGENYLRIEKNANTNFEAIMFKYMKCLIMNRMPIQYFKKFESFQRSRLILTNVIIEILEELNQSRTATHEELLSAFSSIFLYIYAFTFDNEIDGQVLCEYLRSRSFLSPLCLIALVKYIISYLYLFNLLVPSQPINEDAKDTTKNVELQPYTFLDITNDKTLNILIQELPTILSNYFFPKTIKKENEINVNNIEMQSEDNKFYIYMHLSSIEPALKIKKIFFKAKEKLFKPCHVYSMGLLLLRCIIISLQRTLVSVDEKDYISPTFSTFIKNVFAILATTFPEQLATKFFDASITDSKMITSTLGGIFLHLLPVVLRNPTHDNLIKHCLRATDDSPKNGRILIAKLLLSDTPKSSPSVIDKIRESKDLITILNYIDAFTDFNRLRNFKEAISIEKSRLDLLNQLIIENNYTNDIINKNGKNFIFGPFDAISTKDRQMNNLSNSIMKAFKSTNKMNAMNELIINSTDEDQAWVILAFSYTSLIEDESFCETIAEMVASELTKSGQKQASRGNKLNLLKSDHYYVVAQSLLGRLISFSKIKPAIKISQAMIPYLSKDFAALHYITKFLSKYRSMCPIGVLESFSHVVASLPCANEYYDPNRNPEATSLSFNAASSNHSNLINKVFSIAQMLDECSCKLIQNPDVVIQEYQSPFQHAMAFAICIIALTTSNQSSENISNISNSGNIGNTTVSEVGDNSLNMISNSFDFDSNQGSSFYNSYMDFGNFDAVSNFDTPTPTGFNPAATFDPPTPKPSSNPNEIVPESITNDIAEALLSPANCFTRVCMKRETYVKYSAMLAACMDDNVAIKYWDLIVNGPNNELLIYAGQVFLLNANLKILEYACHSLAKYIVNFNSNYSNPGMTDNDLNIKINFFFKILMPSVWRIQGDKRLGLVLLDGVLKSVTKKTPKKLFNTILDIISYVYLKLELFNERNIILNSAIKAGYLPEMVLLLQSILPTTP